MSDHPGPNMYSLGASYASKHCDPRSDVADLEKAVAEGANQLEADKKKLKADTVKLAELTKLLGEVDSAVERYGAIYNEIDSSKESAECFKSGRQDDLKNLEEATKCAIDKCISDADSEISDKQEALTKAEDALSDSQALLQEKEGRLEELTKQFRHDVARAKQLKDSFTTKLKPIGVKIDQARGDLCLVHFLLPSYGKILEEIKGAFIPVDDYRKDLYGRWCQILEVRTEVFEKSLVVDEDSKAVDAADRALTQAKEGRDAAIMKCINSIPACGGPSIPDPTQQATQATS
ncbi:MAG: hypothetical protein AAFV88_04080 [Planctomycetota bacterium]